MGKKNANANAGKGKGKGKDNAESTGGTKTPKGAKSINVRHILCAKESEKNEALAKIRNGAKFDDVAREFSQDKARQGGALGWKTKESLLEPFSKAAFGLAASTTVNPTCAEARTTEGYHIIMVEGRR